MIIRNIAAIVSGMDEEYPYHIIRGINKFAKDNFLNVSYFAAYGNIAGTNGSDIGELSIYNLPEFSKFDGAILITNTFANPELRESIINKVKAANIPTIIFENRDHEEFYDISIDNYSVMRRLVEHLIKEHDVRVFNYVSGPLTNPEALDRFNAFKDVLSENGIDLDENRIFYGGFKSYDGIRAADAFINSGLELPGAFVCANDSMALSLMSKLQRMGYKIPDDVIITGFDHTFNARNSSPVLTTVRRPLYHSGFQACSLLLDLINGEERPHHTLLDAEPVFTESCGCKQEESPDIIEFKINTYERIERTYTSVHMLNRLIAGLSSASSLEECVLAMIQMLKMLDCEKFSLCLISDWEDTYHSLSFDDEAYYSEFMTAPLIWDNETVKYMANFPSRQLMPEPLTTGGNINYFLPLNFGGRCLGYIVMTNSDFPIYSLLCHTMTMNISYAIEHVSKFNFLDPLCKIYNRNGFVQNAEPLYRDCIADKSPITVGFVDLDDLKTINDTYGHKEGDFAIKSIAEAIDASCGDKNVCGRFGGDEFVIFGKGDDFGDKFKKDLLDRISDINLKSGKPYKLSASIGFITTVPSRSDAMIDLIQRADTKMYEIKKERHKNR